jgi:hypothetical protein
MGKKYEHPKAKKRSFKAKENMKPLTNFEPTNKSHLITLYNFMITGKAYEISKRMGDRHHKVSSKERPKNRVDEYTEIQPLEVALRIYTDCQDPYRIAKQIAKSRLWESVKLREKMLKGFDSRDPDVSIFQ